MRNRIGRAALCSLVLCSLFSGCGTGEATYIGQEAQEVSGSPELSAQETSVEREALICVYVCGAVAKPGVVTLREGSRVADALEKAGGFREDAGRDSVNLAARVSDGEKLYFPTEEEGAGDGGKESESGLVNINTADAQLLSTLPGIGASRAADILYYRETNGLFETCEDIMKVPGIKTGVYGKIRDRITVK